MNIYKKHFLEHVDRFIKRNKLIPKGTIYIGVSGGVDSMVLLDLLRNLKLNIAVIFIDHGTRDIQEEERIVSRYCLKFNIRFIRERLKLDLFMSNFENIARIERYKIFYSHLEKDDFIALAHHIDDSFEWFLMQLVKSSSPVFGIPVKRNRIIRPFMAASKDQIMRYAKICKINYVNDSSNNDTKFERNYIRKIIMDLKKRFPGYLKNYAASSKKRVVTNKNYTLKKHNKGITIINNANIPNFSDLEMIITKSIEKLSLATRGTLRKQVKKLILAAKNRKTGPINFTGGVMASIYYGEILLHRKPINFKTGKSLTFDYLSFLNYFLRNDLNGHFIVGSTEKLTILKSLKLPLPKQIIWANYSTKLLYYWGKKKNRRKKFALHIFKVV